MSHQVRTGEAEGMASLRRWFTVPEAAGLLGVSKQTLWRRVRLGVIELPTVDGRLVVPASRLELLRTTDGLVARQYRRRGCSLDRSV